MENNRKPLGHLLTKFSNGVWILTYIGGYFKAKSILTRVNSKTKLLWEENKKVFYHHLKENRKVLKFEREFDLELGAFLFNDERYYDYLLDVFGDSHKSTNNLAKFLETVECPEIIQFKNISVGYDNLHEASKKN